MKTRRVDEHKLMEFPIENRTAQTMVAAAKELGFMVEFREIGHGRLELIAYKEEEMYRAMDR